MRRIVIASTLPDVQNAFLKAHPCQPQVIVPERAVWDPPAGAEALFTFQSQWKNAPAVAPASWPGSLKWLQIASAGVDTFPPWIHAVPLVTRGRGVQSQAIAEYVIGAIYAHEKRFWDARVRSREEWRALGLGAVAGKHVGIAGLGAIGMEVAQSALRIGMQVSAIRRTGAAPVEGVTPVLGIEALIAGSDHLVLALPLTAETRGIINADTLRLARPGLHIINVARGAMIDDAALLAALDAGTVAAATLDVTNPEPLPEGHPFYSHPAIRLTPHVSGMTEDNEERLAKVLASHLDAYLAGGDVPGRVRPDVGY